MGYETRSLQMARQGVMLLIWQAERAEQPCIDAAGSVVAASSAAEEVATKEDLHQTLETFMLEPCGSLHEELCAAAGLASPSQGACSAAAELLQTPDADDESVECIICWEASANVVLQPCGHLCVCLSCVELLRGAVCPMCRGEVLSTVMTEAASQTHDI